ncbi:MAG: aROK [Gammaproteobacteria bacterium]|jgi:shikimate kinase|nr:aROK [Gammaproteobacteria bacterium]
MIILIGFKNVGKSSIGLELARQMQCAFIDLDAIIEDVYAAEQGERLNCRDIARAHGEAYFRTLEKSVFAQTLSKKTAVLSLGGGTVMDGDNQALLKGHTVIHITAPYDLVFERIMSNGMPSFFLPDESPRASFNILWKVRDAVYRQLATFHIYNGSTVLAAVEKILNHNKIREGS